jgi:hypothetical protein
MAWSHEIWNGFHVHQPSMDFGWSTWRDKIHWM